MKNIVCLEIKRAVCSKYLYITIGIILISGIITYCRNQIVLGLSEYGSIGALNVFIYSNIKNNPVLSFLAPFIAALCSAASMDEIISGMDKAIIEKYSHKQYIFAQVFSIIIISAIAFTSAYILSMIGCALFSPAESVRLFSSFGQFHAVFDESLGLYCVAFIIHSALFGMCYALLGFGLFYTCRNRFAGLIGPVLIYYCTTFVTVWMPDKIKGILSYIIPSLTFEISTLDIPLAMHITQLLCILVVSFILIYVKFEKRDNFAGCSKADSKMTMK